MSDALLTIGTPSSAMSTGSGFSWKPRQIRYEDASSIDVQLAEATPDISELLKWAAQPANQPPQQWWDEMEDPFQPPDD